MILIGRNRNVTRFVSLLGLLCLAAQLTSPATTRAQPPRAGESTISGFKPHLPLVRTQPPGEVESLVKSISSNDAMFEVVVGQGRLMTFLQDLVAQDKPKALVALGDPSVIAAEVVGPRQIRVIGQRIGVTDLSITTTEGRTYSFEVQVVANLDVLRAQLRELFPDVSLTISQIREHILVKGDARDAIQIGQIMEAIYSSLESMQAGQAGSQQQGAPQAGQGTQDVKRQVINMIRVVGPQQVMLKVQVAELNRTALRQFGMSWLFNDQISFIGSNTSGAASPFLLNDGRVRTTFTNPTTTIAGLRFTDNGAFQYWIDALRRNSLLKILAEPNVVALNGHEAKFHAGGEFPVPVPQSGAGGGAATITIDYKKFGVEVTFLPTILDGDTIRLSVDPVVSSIDFGLGIELQGFRVPGLNTRNAHTVVELQQGQTLAIAGLMQLDLNGTTRRIPGFGDLPVIGPFFSNNTGERVEKELIVLVTPYLVEPMNHGQVAPRPGDEVKEPNDWEFYMLGRIEGRTGKDFRSTGKWDNPMHLVELLKLEKKHIRGSCGFSD